MTNALFLPETVFTIAIILNNSFSPVFHIFSLYFSLFVEISLPIYTIGNRKHFEAKYKGGGGNGISKEIL